MMGLDRLLRHVGEQRVGAAEADHGELGEEKPDVDQHMVRPEQKQRQHDRRPPGEEADDARCRRLPPTVGGGRRELADVVL